MQTHARESISLIDFHTLEIMCENGFYIVFAMNVENAREKEILAV